MFRVLAWIIGGYAACVWDASCHPLHERWPSATAVYVILLAQHAPDLSLWGAVICGTLLDAAQGGRIGSQAIAGVLAILVSQLGPATSSRAKQATLAGASAVIWLAGPLVLDRILEMRFALSSGMLHQTTLTVISTSLVIFAIHAVLPRPDHTE